ncbi:hypothetical protein DSO57_1024048 [Entomophthora muscae]|uniref:Uncharacterized protein n=1 Tax=Entomophthora muscae TaxID=34485 RepID=A0ACC2RH98_9FUNG|nr:hypothetical protein DSO57_1024048 [Entomophthora muscae]
MNLPDFILLEILTYIERSKLRQLLGLNRRFKALIVEVALTTVVLDKPVIEALRGSSRKRDLVVYATLMTDQVYELKELFKNIRELTIESAMIPRMSLFKMVSSYHSLRALDLFYCDADPIIAFAIAQSRNLTALRAPNFNLSKPQLLKFLSFLSLPYLNSLSIIVDRLDKQVLGMINKAGSKLESLELLSSSASLDISEGLDCIWVKLKSLKISLADKFPETHAAVIFPYNFPQISSLFFSFSLQDRLL